MIPHDDALPEGVSWWIPFDGGLVVAGVDGRLHALDGSAGALLALSGRDRDPGEVARDYAALRGVPRDVVEADVRAATASLRAAGLLDATASPARTVPQFPCTGPRVQATHDLGGLPVAFAGPADDPAAAHVSSILAPLRTDAAPRHLVEVTVGADGERSLSVDGARGSSAASPGEAAGAAFAAMLRLRRPDHVPMGAIHGACVALDGRALVLSAPCGHGKSTLAAGLSLAGLDHLCDDMVALGAPDGRVCPWPAPRSAKPGSWAVLGIDPTGLPLGPHGAVLVPAPASAWDLPAAVPAALAFPRHVAGSPTVVEPVAPLHALARLMLDRVHLGDPLTPAGVSAFLDVLSRTPAHALTYGSRAAGEAAALALLGA